jgi:hypothetical protein
MDQVNLTKNFSLGKKLITKGLNMQHLRVFLFTICLSMSAMAQKRVLIIEAYGKPASFAGVDVSLSRKLPITEHASAVFNFIKKGSCLKEPCKETNASIMFCGYFTVKDYTHCLSVISILKPDIVNMSLSGLEPVQNEKKLILAGAKHSVIVIAAGNNKENYLAYPAIYSIYSSNILAISALNEFGERLKTSNKTKNSIDFLGIGYYNNHRITGTSVAAALYTHKLATQ